MIKILAIDDDIKITYLMKDFFNNIGYDIITKNNGGEGITAFNRDNIDIVITDIDMPGVNGNEVARRIRRSRKRKKRKIPIIALTGGLDKNIEKNLFNYVLKKPIKLNTLLRTINSCSHKH